ncbi:MAG: YebC/PmpR family DNA-binding transcriptional regulator [Candidatus Krumholzibacteriota bacterium]|nr:YebC/PmpR family DNA-binding transcriptional regulator [Candidatus Krumholzibacteriota bacterium]
MSGHSKWSTIKRKKGKADAERSKVFTKLIKEITVSAREGGGDKDSNPRLRSAVQSAKDANMPVANIEKAIKRGTGELPGVIYESCTFEGYATGGVAVLVESLTDNRNRTTAEVRHIFSKFGGHLGEPNSVSYLFESKGVIIISEDDDIEEKVYEIALENGAEDVRSESGQYEIISPPDTFENLREKITGAELVCELAEISLHPKTVVSLDLDTAKSVIKLVSALEDNDDVQRVSANFDIPDDVMIEIEKEY